MLNAKLAHAEGLLALADKKFQNGNERFEKDKKEREEMDKKLDLALNDTVRKTEFDDYKGVNESAHDSMGSKIGKIIDGQVEIQKQMASLHGAQSRGFATVTDYLAKITDVPKGRS